MIYSLTRFEILFLSQQKIAQKNFKKKRKKSYIFELRAKYCEFVIKTIY